MSLRRSWFPRDAEATAAPFLPISSHSLWLVLRSELWRDIFRGSTWRSMPGLQTERDVFAGLIVHLTGERTGYKVRLSAVS